MKKIVINNTEFEILSTAYTRFLYNKKFERKLFKDLDEVTIYFKKNEEIREKLEKEGKDENEIAEIIGESSLDVIDDVLDIVFRITYILIYTANPNFESFESWLNKMENVNLDAPWITECLDYCFSTFRGQGVDSRT